MAECTYIYIYIYVSIYTYVYIYIYIYICACVCMSVLLGTDDSTFEMARQGSQSGDVSKLRSFALMRGGASEVKSTT